MHKLVLIRHGESTWNLENRFTGWTDVDLTPTGVEQAKTCRPPAQGRKATTSTSATPACSSAPPARCGTAWTRWTAPGCRWCIPGASTSATTARLQGLNKAETAKKFGDEQVLVWRRSYDTPPPPLEPGDPRSERGDIRYAKLAPEQVPLTECLKDTVAGCCPSGTRPWRRRSRRGKRVLVAAHGNSIRALVKYLDGISDTDIVGLNIPNGIPLVYELDDDLKPLRHYYLGDAEAAAKAAAAVASQGKA